MVIEKENMTVKDTLDKLVETEKGITCGCENPELRMTCHIDGSDFYSCDYQCSCGNAISVTHKRNKSDMMMHLEGGGE